MAASVVAQGSGPHLVEAAGSVLDAITDPGVNLCVWARPCPAWAVELASVERAFDEALDAKLCLELDALHVEPLVAPLRVRVRSEVVDALADDVRMLARRLGAIAGRDHLDATLSVLHADGCKKLHVDEKGIRLLCTYVGPGTEWAPNHVVDRSALSSHGYDFARANAAIAGDAPLRVIERGWVGLLKGDGWPGNRGKGIVHRSPLIAERGLRRLVLTIDAKG